MTSRQVYGYVVARDQSFNLKDISDTFSIFSPFFFFKKDQLVFVWLKGLRRVRSRQHRWEAKPAFTCGSGDFAASHHLGAHLSVQLSTTETMRLF